MRIYRVVVRGEFADLDEEGVERLRAAQPEHDIFVASFTPEGSFVYDDRLVAFNFRFEVRDPDDLSQAEIGEAALEKAEARLKELRFGHKRLRVGSVADMAAVWDES